MSDQPQDTIEESPHEGGFRPHTAISTERGGKRYAEINEQVRQVMDNARYACPTDEMSDEIIDALTRVNELLSAVRIDEWHSPAGTRIDLPARGNVTLPPYTVDEVVDNEVTATITFRDFHLGGNNAAHGGHIALGFDDLGGFAAAVATQWVCRTAYLTVNYRAITPLNTPLTMRTWAERVDGRKAFIKGTLHHDDVLCAEMDGLFIKLNPGQA